MRIAMGLALEESDKNSKVLIVKAVPLAFGHFVEAKNATVQ